MNGFPKRQIYIWIPAALVLVALIGGAYYWGYKNGRENPQTIVIQGVSNVNQGKDASIDFGLFWDAWSVIKDKYVDAGKLDNRDLVNGAVSGLVGALKDPYSVFLPPSDAQKFSEDLSGQFSGIGAEIGIKNDHLLIVAPLKNSPAEAAGLKAGDQILQINGSSTIGITVDEAVKQIRGEEGTIVKLTIMRNGWTTPKDIPIKRDVIRVPTLNLEMKGPNKDIAYIQLYNFFEQAPFQFYQAALKVAAANSKGIILDLRNNPGGFLEVGIDITGWFLKPGEVVVREQFRAGNERVYNAMGSGLFKNIPVVILINQGSASASEILTGALHDVRGVKTVGMKSFGKGTVQELETLKDNSLLKITIAHWLTPKGHLIDKNGITPDYSVDLGEDDIKAGRDPQFDRALQIIEGEITSGLPSPTFQLQYR